MFTATDHSLMARALRLAHRGRYWARPNPHVGCVIARGDQVVGEGFTQPAGGHHAEVMALADAGDAARGGTAYVTLEPCAHHGRTPPCAEALLDAGLSRVVVALEDPNPAVAGQGIRSLQEAGLRVDVGLMAGQVDAQLAGFLSRFRRGHGRVRAKIAMSLDGRTAMASGESQWITGPAARADVQRLRAESCAVVTGAGTVRADNCALTVRDEYFGDEDLLPPPERRALRVVADTQLTTPADAAVLSGPQASLLLHTSDTVVPGHLADVAAPIASGEEGLDPAQILSALTERSVNEILLESGPSLCGAFLRAGLIDQLIVYVAPRLLGSRARPMFELPLDQMSEAMNLELLEHRQLGPDQRFIFEPRTANGT